MPTPLVFVLGDELAQAVSDLLLSLNHDGTLQISSTTLLYVIRTDDALGAYLRARGETL